MKYPLDELLDKRSIIQLKIERIPHSKKELKKEFDDYTKAIMEYNIPLEKIELWHNQLYEINKQIWDLEADIRKGKEGQLGLEEVGRRALIIRDKNSKRILIKRNIVEYTGIGYLDIKDQHCSQID